MSQHGGRRPGAGRPPNSRNPQTRRNVVSLRLSDEELAQAKDLGQGQAGPGLREALRLAMRFLKCGRGAGDDEGDGAL